MNKTYFCLFFKKHYGMSFTDYINRKRLEAASAMLLKPDTSIAEVALACGYPTVTYFNRIFRKFKGMTPSEYRKSKQI
jgi:two-component system response regulator YesN